MGAQLTTSPRHYLTAVYSFTRPSDTTAYADTDLVANSTTAGSVVPMSWVLPYGHTYSLLGIRLRKSGTTATNGSFRLHLYAASPVPSNGDNGTWLTTQVDDYLGHSGTVVMLGFADGCGITTPMTTPFGIFGLTSRTIYGLLEAKAAYTPASAEIFTAQLIIGCRG